MFGRALKDKKDKKDRKEEEKRTASPKTSARKSSTSKREDSKRKMMKLGDDSESLSASDSPGFNEARPRDQPVTFTSPKDSLGVSSSSSSHEDIASSPKSPSTSGKGGLFRSSPSPAPFSPQPGKATLYPMSSSSGAGMPRDFDGNSDSESDERKKYDEKRASLSSSTEDHLGDMKKAASYKHSSKSKDEAKKPPSKPASPSASKRKDMKAESSTGLFSRIKEPKEDNEDDGEEIKVTTKAKKKGLTGFFTSTSTTKSKTGSSASLASSGGHASPAEIRKEEKKEFRSEGSEKSEESEERPSLFAKSPKTEERLEKKDRKEDRKDRKDKKKETEKSRQLRRMMKHSDDSESCESEDFLSPWQTETGLTPFMFRSITKYFSDGNNRTDNANRAAIMKLPEGVRVAPGVNIRLHDPTAFGKEVHIGQFSYINGHVQIDDDVTVGPQCSMTSNTHLFNPDSQSFKGRNESKPIWIKRGCWIAAGVTVAAGITIGECSLVCAGAVVTHDVPDYSIVAGIPARITGTIDPSTGEKTWFSKS